MNRKTLITVSLALVVLLSIPAASSAQGTFFVENNRARVENLTTTSNTLLFQLKAPSGVPIYRFASSFGFWDFTGGFLFSINQADDPAVEFRVDPTGNLTIAGTLTQGSSRAVKQSLEVVDSSEMLARVVALPLSEWSYKEADDGVRHFGPMAEDFRAAFELGADAQHLAPGDAAGVALAAIQGLNQKLDAKAQRVAELEAELEALKALVYELGSVQQ